MDLFYIIKNMISRVVSTTTASDSSGYKTIQTSSWGTPQKTQLFELYGAWSNPPIGSDGIGFNVCGAQSNRVTALFGSQVRYKPDGIGAYKIGNAVIGSYIHFNGDGDIEISSPKNLNITINGTANITSSGNVTITAPKTTINGDLEITGNMVGGGVDYLTHKHIGVQSGTSVSGIPQQ